MPSVAERKDDGKRQAQKMAVAHVNKAGLDKGNNLSVRNQLRDAATRHHQNQRRDNRLNSESGDEQSVPTTRQERDAKRARDDHREGNVRAG